MRIIIICGAPECGEEYPAETEERLWVCPHCGRERENKYYPFLTATLMNARIHSDEAPWKEHHDELLSKARGKVTDLRDHMDWLRKDLARLRARLPEEERAKLADQPSEDAMDGFLGSWVPDASPDDMGAWRDLHDQLLDGAREEIITLEVIVHDMEDEVINIKSILGLA